MREDGIRLSYSINGKAVAIMNNMDGTSLVLSENATTPISTLDRAMLYNHVTTLQGLVMRNQIKTFGYKPFTKSDMEGVSIIECDHFSYRIIVDSKCAELTEVSFRAQRGFDIQKLLTAINYAYSVAASNDPVLQPKRDIVRRIADVGVLVWVYKGRTLVCKDVNINGCTLRNCLIDDTYYQLVYVSINNEQEKCFVFDEDLHEIFSVPLDKSILTYFHEDNDTV